MYSLRQARRALSHRKVFLRELNRLYYTRGRRRAYDPEGIDVFAEDWDSLLLLDACRYDAFAARSDLPGRLERRRSRGSHTAEFARGNFDGRDLLDTVYVTGSMVPYRDREEGDIDFRFHAEVNVWNDEGWDEEFKTVHPETMVEHAKRAAETYPEKRLLVHFLQPHFPAIGPIGREHPEFNSLNLWHQADLGELEIPDSVLRKAYVENLDEVLPHVADLLDSLSGKTVVSADHGQMIGERSFPIPFAEHGHPPGIYTDALTTVPWLVHENGPRREIVAEEPDTDAERAGDEPVASDEVVADRLEDLGYVE